MFILALFTVSKIWKQPRWPSIDKEVVVHTHTYICGVYIYIYIYIYIYTHIYTYYSAIRQLDVSQLTEVDKPRYHCTE